METERQHNAENIAALNAEYKVKKNRQILITSCKHNLGSAVTLHLFT